MLTLYPFDSKRINKPVESIPPLKCHYCPHQSTPIHLCVCKDKRHPGDCLTRLSTIAKFLPFCSTEVSFHVTWLEKMVFKSLFQFIIHRQILSAINHFQFITYSLFDRHSWIQLVLRATHKSNQLFGALELYHLFLLRVDSMGLQFSPNSF